MQNKIFISYSRRELGFVDDLVGDLEEKKYDVWLDYRVLIPGSPWAEQIDKGLKEADTVLLVVSKASLASEFVALEWRHFLETKKRVILLIFEAVDIPAELEKYEWVDFRGNYQAGLNELFSQLTHPIQEEHPVPESGFKAPAVVWGTIVFSAIVAFLSLNTLWTIFIPFLLIPLPYQIFKRSFDFMRVQAALLAMPFAITLSYLVLGNTLYGQLLSLHIETSDPVLTSWLTALSSGLILGVWGWILLALLRSPAMLRWGRPEATPPKFKNPYKPNINTPEPTPFFIEHAFEDRVVAEELKSVLKKYGHPEAENVHDAKAVLVVISRFNAETSAVPAKQVVFPVMVQENAKISSTLSKVQWIDFRPGVRGLDAIAQLLPNPRELLKALGMRPVSSLSVYPPMVTTLYYFILVLSVIFVGAILDYVFFTDILSILDPESYNLIVGGLVAGALLFGSLSFFMIRSLLTRTGLFSRSLLIFGGIIAQGSLMAGLTAVDKAVYHAALDAGIDVPPTFIAFGDLIFIGGVVMLIIVFTKNRLDLKRWFPSKN
ncbi:MAG: toll/interleukin-1 receptor domain-containing protein [Anaerolineales bacterium]|nr:toll/interleukin-1 receptor domain-containing protein [Anaerolineales bacterium]